MRRLARILACEALRAPASCFHRAARAAHAAAAWLYRKADDIEGV